MQRVSSGNIYNYPRFDRWNDGESETRRSRVSAGVSLILSTVAERIGKGKYRIDKNLAEVYRSSLRLLY